jgi:acyl-CoA synthetase (AMP-forming)/AMP-acid ligase II
VLLHQLVEATERAAPGDPALHFHDRTISFGELGARIRRAAAATSEIAPEAGSRVAMVGPNHPAWISAYYGVPRAGRILLFLNHRLAPPELASLVERSDATAVIGPPEQLDPLRSALPRACRSRLVDLDEWERTCDEATDEPAERAPVDDPSAPAWLLYTSGTTGRPKGAILTHRSLLAGVAVSRVGRPVAPGAVGIFPFPLCHVAGYNVLCHHDAGRPVVLLPRFEAGTFLEAVGRWRGTSTTVTATMLAALLDDLDADPAAPQKLSSLVSMTYGAAPMPPVLLRRLRRHLDVALSQGYGMTELSGNAAFLGPEEHERGLAGEEHLLVAAGRPGPGVEMRVVDDDMRPLPTGGIGEIVVRGAQVMAGYWGDPGATATTLVDGWLRTGDLGRFDEEGLLYVVDRKKDVIVTGGENVASREVEEAVLRCCPEVREVAVVAVPDRRWGENTPARGARIDPEALVGTLRDQLAGFKLPRQVVVVEELPKNATGKVQKHELRTWLAEHPEAAGRRRG